MKHGKRRKQLLDAALVAFGEGGYHGTHVSHVIARAGVARGTFYRHFLGKHDIFMALIDQVFRDLEAVIEQVDLSREVSPLVQLQQNLRRFVDVLLARPALTRLLLEQGLPLEAPVRERMQRFYRDLAGLVEHSLERGEQMGLLRPLDRPVVARALVGAVKEVVYAVVENSLPRDLEHLSRIMVDFAATGVLRGGQGIANDGGKVQSPPPERLDSGA